ncbi:DNA repair protein RecO [Lacihabitans sp. LS3-19]|uniref:DNA repair protein RecO n=1 Tax=Lacihabitans sp. LS3-19 TaxID=2487335 RepID=UPI0020CE0D42|nr:DNA repair protein RecO [Lacihabitans sp. LS3-19]MCP9769132.1 DNA repair protein RecO [Lacihabitans sp. LS3-19]
MLHKTKGIVISFIKYKETSIIVKIYTEKFGIQTYIENGVRSSKGKNKIALFQPLTLLDMVVYHDTKKEIHRLSEVKCLYPYNTITVDIKKSSLGIFINEVLNNSLKEHAENIPLFNFLLDSLKFLDQHEDQIENFHLYFLINYCFYLGFGPENARDVVEQLYDHAFPVNDAEAEQIQKMISSDFGTLLNIGKKMRLKLLELLLVYYKIHVENFGDLRSLGVLKEVLE